MTSVFNVARVAYLAGITIFFVQNDGNHDEAWIALYILTFTSAFPICFYLFGFKIREDPDEDSQQQTVRAEFLPNLIDSSPKRRTSSSIHETELSQSVWFVGLTKFRLL